VGAAIAVVTPETPDKRTKFSSSRFPQPQKLPICFAEMAKIERPENVLSLGILVWQRDRDPKAKDKAVVWAATVSAWPEGGGRTEESAGNICGLQGR